MMENFTTFLEEKLMPIATKFSTQRHLKAIRDAFICIMPITLAGGIVSVISAAPAPEGTTNGLAKKVKVKTGTAYMALRTGTKVLPVGIKTTKTNRVIVNIGKTLNYNEQKEKNPDKEKLEETTKEIMDTIIMLTETAK